MKVKINKLLPYNEQNKKLKLAAVTVQQRNYYISPTSIDQKNYVGCLVQLHFICNVPDINSDYEYVKCQIKIENAEYKGIIDRKGYNFEGIKRGEGKREFIYQFIPPYRGNYTITLELAYKQKFFIQTNQPPEEKRDSLQARITCQDSYTVQENIIYEEKPSSISFPLFVQYVVTNRLKETLELGVSFISEAFKHKLLNESKIIQILGGESYFIMLEIDQRKDDKIVETIVGSKGLPIGTLLLQQGKSKQEKKLFLKQGFQHILFKGEIIDKKVVKKDIVQVRVKFINIYGIDYGFDKVRIGVDEGQIPAGIKLLKISKDKIDLMSKSQEIVTLTLICLRSGLFQMKGIVLFCRGKSNPLQERSLKYINELGLIVQNQKEEKKDTIMEKTTQIEIQLI